jgi:hypothetical protein
MAGRPATTAAWRYVIAACTFALCHGVGASRAEVILTLKPDREQIRELDPLCVRVEVHNGGEEPVAIGHGLGTPGAVLTYEIRREGEGDFERLAFTGGTGSACILWITPPEQIEPGGTRVGHAMLFQVLDAQGPDGPRSVHRPSVSPVAAS